MKPRLPVPLYRPTADGNVFAWVLMLARREREHQSTCSVSRASAMWRAARPGEALPSVYAMGAAEYAPAPTETAS